MQSKLAELVVVYILKGLRQQSNTSMLLFKKYL